MNEMTEYAQRVKEVVSVRNLLELNGIQVNRHGFAICPLHGDRDASLKVYGGSRGWVCYGCHKGGDVINLAMELYGMSFADAVRRLNDEFSVGIDFGKKLTTAERFQIAGRAARAKFDRQRAEEKERATERAYLDAFSKWLDLDHKVQEMAEKLDRKESFPPEFCVALRERALAYEEVQILEERRISYGKQ